MKKLFIIIIIFISFQSWTKADDIRDFEIEGMSIGDSALDFFKKETIDDIKSYYPNSKKFFRASLAYKSNSFERIQLHIIDNDPNYTIHAISGLIFYREKSVSEENCLKKHNEIRKDLSSSLSNLKISKAKKEILKQDKTGNSHHYTIYYDFNEKKTEFIKLGCVIYGKEYFDKKGFFNHLRLGFQNKRFTHWMQNDAF